MKRIWILLFMFLLLLCRCGGSGNDPEKKDSSSGYTQIDQETAKEMMARDDGHVIVDVRRQDEYDAGHIPGAVLIPNETITDTPPSELPDPDQIILIYCRSGNRSKQAAQKLADMGYSNVYEFGGIQDWTGEIVTEAVEDGTPGDSGAEETILEFSSFDGGGHVYTAVIVDPSVLSCSTSRDYGRRQEAETGSRYRQIFSFKGLKSGETTVKIYGLSPIMEADNHIYQAEVDEELHVTLTPVRSISYFDMYRYGEMYYNSYRITLDPEGYLVSVNGEEEQKISEDTVKALFNAYEEYDVASWNGFDEERNNVLDGEGFYIEIRLTDETHIIARGDNAFPEYYGEVVNTWQELLDEAEFLPAED